MRYLAVVLLAPWLLILSWWYWTFPKLPRSTARRWFDVLALLLAATLCLGLANSAFDRVTVAPISHDGPPSGAIWKQVMPVLYGYGAFVAVLALALLLRWQLWKPRASRR